MNKRPFFHGPPTRMSYHAKHSQSTLCSSLANLLVVSSHLPNFTLLLVLSSRLYFQENRDISLLPCLGQGNSVSRSLLSVPWDHVPGSWGRGRMVLRWCAEHLKGTCLGRLGRVGNSLQAPTCSLISLAGLFLQYDFP